MSVALSDAVLYAPAWLMRADEECAPDPDAALAAAAAHDPDAFAALYDRYYDRVLNLLHRRTRSRETAEDLTAEAFTAAWRQLQRGRPPVAFRPWLYRVALNAWVSHGRRQTTWRGIAGMLAEWLPVAAPPRAAAQAEDEELGAAARRELMRLPARYREPVLLRIDDEMDYDDIAAVLDLTPSGARTRVARGLRLLRRRLGLSGEGREDAP